MTNPMTLDAVADALDSGFRPLFQCEAWSQGEIRVNTEFLLPDCDLISVFLFERDEQTVVSDYATGFLWLKMNVDDQSVPPLIRAHIAEIADSLQITLNGVQLEVACDDRSELADAILRVCQGVIRVAELQRVIYPDRVYIPEDQAEHAPASEKRNFVHSAD